MMMLFLNCRFQLYYFSDPEVKKEDRNRKQTILTIDTRDNMANGGGTVDAADTEFDEAPVPILERALQTK